VTVMIRTADMHLEARAGFPSAMKIDEAFWRESVRVCGSRLPLVRG
jgi:hypothetical protein